MSDLFSSVMKFGNTLQSKLDQAEYSSEYNNGMETLRRGLTEFDLQLEKNPDWRKYPELATQKENELWQQVDKSTSHQGAKNDLQTTWQQMRDQHLAKIGDLSNRVRISTYHADLVKRMDGRQKDVEAGTLSAIDAQKANDADLKQAGATMVVDPEDSFTASEAFAKEVQYQEASRKIRAIGSTQGWDAAMKAVNPMVAQYDHLNAKNADQLTLELQRYATIARADYNRKVKDNNGKIEDDVMQALFDGNIGKANQILHDGKFMDEEGGLSAADNQYQWFQRIHTYSQDELANKRAADKDNTVSDGFLADATNENINPEVTFSNARDAMIHHQITATQFKQVQSALSPRVKARVQAYEDLFKTDTSMAPDLVNRLKTAQGYFRSWAADNLDASDKEISTQAEGFHKQAIDKTLFSSMSAYYSARREAMSGVAAGKPLNIQAITKAPEVPQQLTNKKISVTRSQTSNGTTYYDGADGKVYQVAKSGAVLWWDGKTWQTLK